MATRAVTTVRSREPHLEDDTARTQYMQSDHVNIGDDDDDEHAMHPFDYIYEHTHT